MALILWCSVLAALFSNVSAHYVFHQLIVNGTYTEPWQYVRNVTAHIDAYGTSPPDPTNPMLDLYSTNMRCNTGSLQYGPTTDVATVIAGSEVGFAVNNPSVGIFHTGFGAAYLSKADSDIYTYDGSKDWFKIAEVGLDPVLAEQNKVWWVLTGKPEYNFTIPQTTPPGHYLLRVEHVWPRFTFNDTQVYAACAQVNIIGSGGGTPGPMTKIPGAYDSFDPGIWISYDLASGYGANPKTKEYKIPGPRVWTD